MPNLLRDQGFLAEATRLYTQALALDPLNSAILENQALLMAYQGRFEIAIKQLQKLDRREPGRLTGSLAAYRVWSAAGNNEKALELAQRATDLAPESPVALAALVDSNVRLGNLTRARVALDRMNESSPNNEIAITATLRYYLMTDNFLALDELASRRVKSVLDNEASYGSDLILERVRWGAIARLGLDDASGAREMLEKGIPALDDLDPRPVTVRVLALLARAKKLEGDSEGAAEASASASRLAELARSEGWAGGTARLCDCLCCRGHKSIGESTGSPARCYRCRMG